MTWPSKVEEPKNEPIKSSVQPVQPLRCSERRKEKPVRYKDPVKAKEPSKILQRSLEWHKNSKRPSKDTLSSDLDSQIDSASDSTFRDEETSNEGQLRRSARDTKSQWSSRLQAGLKGLKSDGLQMVECPFCSVRIGCFAHESYKGPTTPVAVLKSHLTSAVHKLNEGQV